LGSPSRSEEDVVFVENRCPSARGVPAGYDTVGFFADMSTGVVEKEPGYPFLASPTGFAHDVTGDTIYYVYP
jgi:hypothetical protein